MKRSKELSALAVRDMQGEDLSQVLIIERAAQVSPWSRLSFEESLNRQHLCRLVTDIESVVAYHVVCAVADELHILNLVVAKSMQGIGLGHVLMDDILAIAEAQNLTKIFLEVRASNLVAQSLYAKWQFEQIALRKGYYAASTQTLGQREDAMVLMRKIPINGRAS